VVSRHDLAEQRLLGAEVRVEGAARQARRQHDVVDGSRLEAAQSEQASGVVENVATARSGASRVGGHAFLQLYVYYHTI
jgi:hypothetical protein